MGGRLIWKWEDEEDGQGVGPVWIDERDGSEQKWEEWVSRSEAEAFAAKHGMEFVPDE